MVRNMLGDLPSAVLTLSNKSFAFPFAYLGSTVASLARNQFSFLHTVSSAGDKELRPSPTGSNLQRTAVPTSQFCDASEPSRDSQEMPAEDYGWDPFR